MMTSYLKVNLSMLAAVAVLSCAAWANPYYVDAGRGDDAADGSREKPFRTIARAVKAVDGTGGEVHLAEGSGPYRENVVIHKGGSAEKRLVIDGHGATVNLGEDVTAGPWTQTENGWRLERPVELNDRYFVASPIFVNGLPIFSDHPEGKAPGAWHGGSVRYDAEGHLILVFPKGLTPQNSVIVRPSGEKMICGVALSSANFVTVRNLTVAFAPNDGFNLHAKGGEVSFENIRAVFNGDQGVSSHETCSVDVKDSEIAFNGTRSGGVTDINASVTSYRNVRIHQNRGPAFTLAGQHHVVEHVASFGNPGGNLPKVTEKIEVIDSQDLGKVELDATVPVYSPEVPVSKKPEESDRLGRFLQLRPPQTPVVFTK